jgi:hypothetical protein
MTNDYNKKPDLIKAGEDYEYGIGPEVVGGRLEKKGTDIEHLAQQNPTDAQSGCLPHWARRSQGEREVFHLLMYS